MASVSLGSVTFRSHGPNDIQPLVEPMAALFASDFVDPPENQSPFYSKDRFFERMKNYVKSPGFAAVTAHENGELVGFVYGSDLTPGTRWWKTLVTPLPSDYIEESGSRTYAIFDMLVKKGERGRGISSVLHGQILNGRPEERVSLLSSEPQQPAYTIWHHWGYQVIAQAKPDPNGPVLDVFMRDLPL